MMKSLVKCQCFKPVRVAVWWFTLQLSVTRSRPSEQTDLFTSDVGQSRVSELVR